MRQFHTHACFRRVTRFEQFLQVPVRDGHHLLEQKQKRNSGSHDFNQEMLQKLLAKRRQKDSPEQSLHLLSMTRCCHFCKQVHWFKNPFPTGLTWPRQQRPLKQRPLRRRMPCGRCCQGSGARDHAPGAHDMYLCFSCCASPAGILIQDRQPKKTLEQYEQEAFQNLSKIISCPACSQEEASSCLAKGQDHRTS